MPARAVIHDAFEEHIIHAPGMERIGELVTGRILPTPGAVLLAAERLAEDLGDLVVIDVGGATTDVHSVTDGSPEIAAIQTEPQPHSKRTVEGDLGTFVSAAHVAAMLPDAERPAELPPALPTTRGEIEAARSPGRVLRRHRRAAPRRPARPPLHADRPPDGRPRPRPHRLPLLIGTGGALTRLPGGLEMLAATRASANGGDRLLPPADARCALDRDYIFACCGALLAHFDGAAVVALLRGSAGV